MRTISFDDLCLLDACGDQLDRFDELFGLDAVEITPRNMHEAFTGGLDIHWLITTLFRYIIRRRTNAASTSINLLWDAYENDPRCGLDTHGDDCPFDARFFSPDAQAHAEGLCFFLNVALSAFDALNSVPKETSK